MKATRSIRFARRWKRAWKSGIVVVVAAGNDGRYLPTNGYAHHQLAGQRSLRDHRRRHEAHGNAHAQSTI